MKGFLRYIAIEKFVILKINQSELGGILVAGERVELSTSGL
jgi:hypothetical protein